MLPLRLIAYDPLGVKPDGDETTLHAPPLPKPTQATPPRPPRPPLRERLRALLARFAPKRPLPLNKWIVSTYRALGFAILTVVVLGLVSYIATNVFYLVSSSWVTPAIISPTDDRVLSLHARMAEEQSQRDKLAAERALVAAQLADVERVITTDERFRDSFRRAVSADAADRRAQLRKVRALFSDYASARSEIDRSNRAYAGMSRARNDRMREAHLVDDEGYLTGNYQLSQLAHSNLELAERAVELDTRTSTLQRDAEAFAAAADGDGDRVVSWDALRERQEYERATLELEKARDQQRALAESLAAADRSIARYDRLIESIGKAPLLAAAEGRVTVVLVPYDNLHAARPGAPLYRCALGFVGCRRVGEVRALLPGEMDVRHPLHSSQELRGQAVEVQIDVVGAAGERVLFAGGRPLGI